MQTTLSMILIDAPRVAAVWLVLLAVAVVAVTAFWKSGRTTRGEREAPAESLPDSYPDPVAEADRYADEVSVAAHRAAATAQRRYAEWEKARDAADMAWQAFDGVDHQTRRLASAAAIPAPHTPRTPAEYADRERYLHRAATAAYQRGELSRTHLADVLAKRNGWDPRLHPVQQELVLHRFIRAHLLHTYLHASAAERYAWRAAELADAAMRSLRAESAAAARRAEVAVPAGGSAWLEEQLRRGATVVHPVASPRLATR